MSKQGFEVIGVSSKGQELQDVQNEEHIKTIELEMTRSISPIQDLISLYNFYSICKKEKPLIVHSHTPKAGIVGMLGAKLAKVPIRLHTVAGLPLMETAGLKRKILDFVEKLTYKCSTKIYPNSKGLYDFILENKYTTKEKLKVIANGSSNGINSSFFSPSQVSEEQKTELKQQLGIKPNDFVFIFVGRLVGDKGINELIDAFSYLNIHNTKLLLVGTIERELDPLKEKTIKEIETNPSIISVGFQKDVRPYFAISNALVFPSYREGFPNVVMQAGAMELPCIVSNINGCNEIIIEGKNGMIVPVKNIEQLREKMSILSQNKNLYEQLRLNSRKTIIERYEQTVIWQEILNEYNQLMKTIL
ncbi:glycosyltransferase family 1 protein [Capnocytophaga cynodegmi]|uniref:Glycosyltransferase family 1 protein n=1 Tax=Capnocytophaga cynodegmi TaxID=28189 RepID=A0A250E6C7_9FLAO|nr:glycosyltransferase family 4 protein [Capnocytophaga cynodegmi]ATA68463.1 glycosyltransferase family 1 protein [Capnocytophaga cynodegmi]